MGHWWNEMTGEKNGSTGEERLPEPRCLPLQIQSTRTNYFNFRIYQIAGQSNWRATFHQHWSNVIIQTHHLCISRCRYSLYLATVYISLFCSVTNVPPVPSG